ncbi:MAG: hypothetical protein SCH66_14915 [Methanolobus sp.]|nr:hypothetical protein [Methanolobus sp.]
MTKRRRYPHRWRKCYGPCQDNEKMRVIDQAGIEGGPAVRLRCVRCGTPRHAGRIKRGT